jgi:hypothetical protein
MIPELHEFVIPAFRRFMIPVLCEFGVLQVHDSGVSWALNILK